MNIYDEKSTVPFENGKETTNMTMPLNRKTELEAPNSDQVPNFKTDQQIKKGIKGYSSSYKKST